MDTKADKKPSAKGAVSKICKQLNFVLSANSKVYRDTRKAWKELKGHRSSPEEMGEHLDSMLQSLDDSDCQAETTDLQEEYKEKEGDELVTSGSVTVLSDVIMDSLQSLSKNAEKALKVLSKFCTISGKVIRAVATQGQLLSTLVAKLDQLYQPDRAALSDTAEGFVSNSLVLVEHISSNDEHVESVRRIPKVFQIVQKFVALDSGILKFTAIRVLANIASDEEAKKLATTSNVINFLLTNLQQALKDSSQKVKLGATHVRLRSILTVISKLARNNDNSRLLVEEGVLPLLVEAFNSPQSKKSERKVCMETLRWLSFNKENQADMMANTALIDCVANVFKDTSHHCHAAAEAILFQLRGRLCEHTNQDYRSVGERFQRGTQRKPQQSSKEGGQLKLETQGEQLQKDAGGMQQQSSKPGGQLQRMKSTVSGHVMFSYQSANRTDVRRVCDFLQEKGIKVWMDVHNMAEGESSTVQTMAEAVEDSAVFIMCMSERYKNSLYCRQEAEYAFEQGKRIIPLKLQKDYKPDGWLGFILGSKYFYDFTKEDRFEEKLRGLLAAVSKVFYPDSEAPTEGQLTAKSQPSTGDVTTATGQGKAAAKTPSLPASKLERVKRWTRDEADSWIQTHNLQGEKVQSITGEEIAYLLQVKSEAPEVFHQMLVSQLQLTSVLDVARLNSALDDLQLSQPD